MKKIQFFIIISLLSIGINATAQKKNSIILQTGILNHFYDENPILMNTSKIGNINRIKDFMNQVLIKSVGITYNRSLTEKSSLSFSFGKFNAFFNKKKNTLGCKS